MYSVKDDIFCFCVSKQASYYTQVYLEKSFHNVMTYNPWVAKPCNTNGNGIITGDRLADTHFTPVTHFRIAPAADIARLQTYRIPL